MIDLEKTFVNDPYIKLYENVFSREFCSDLINRYEQTINEEREKIDTTSLCMKDGKKLCQYCDCLRIDITQHDKFKEDIRFIYNTLSGIGKTYFEQTGVVPAQLPDKYGYEVIRIKRYLPYTNEGMIGHVDVKNYEYARRRFLTFVVYLNDNFEGGRTIFHKHDNVSFKPVTGNVLVFPPLWPWLHEAEKVKGEVPKYILGTYLHYVD